MKIDELPVEILTRIFSYLLTFKRISLANRKFYEVACIVNDKNVSLTLDTKFFETAKNRPLLESIEGSSRKIKEVRIYLRKFTGENKRSIISVLTKFSATIKHLQLTGCRDRFQVATILERAYFLAILSLVPNAEYLAIDNLGVSYANKYLPETSNQEDLNLKHLTILKLDRCDEIFEVVFNRLPVGVLREFSWSGRNLLRLETLFFRQTNIQRLSLVQWNNRVPLPAHILDNLELELLKMRNIDIETAALSRQTKLKSLHTDRDHVIVKVVADSLSDLEELEWKVADITPVNDFENISRLKNLKRIQLIKVGTTGILNEFIQLDNSRIATLEIEYFYGLTIPQFQVLAKSAPNLKVLKLERFLNWDTITEVLSIFNFVESLTFGNIGNVGSYEKYLNQKNSVNEKLTELNFSMKYETPVLRKMIADYPNLKKLTIFSRTDLTSSHFQLILDDFTKLESFESFESFELSAGNQLTIDDFKYLRDHRNRLKFLHLYMDEAFVNQHLEELEAMFEVVKYWSRIGFYFKIRRAVTWVIGEAKFQRK